MRLVLVVCALAACGGPEAGVPAGVDAAPSAAAAPPDAPPPPPPYGPEVTSLRLRRSIVVRFEPRADAKQIGTVEEGTRVGWKRAAAGPGCPRWIEIEPRGWICDKYLEPTTKPPAGEARPKLAPGEIVPGVYGKVVGSGAIATKGKTRRKLAGAVTVRKIADVVVGGRKFWKISTGELVPAGQIAVDTPSSFAGVKVDALPLAWAQSRKN